MGRTSKPNAPTSYRLGLLPSSDFHCGHKVLEPWLPQEILAAIATAIAKKDQQFIMANGQTITRSIGYVILRAGGFETVDEAVFGQPGDMAILGSHTLEGFGAVVDPRRKKLVAAGPYPAAANG